MVMSEEVEKNEEENPETSEDSNTPDPDWKNRRLCSDGNCIGVIGPDGRCKECGRPYEGKLPETLGHQNDIPPVASSEESALQTSEASSAQSPAPSSPEDLQTGSKSDASSWENRVLCSDGNCIGVIGRDGRCKECGKPYDPDAENS
jgi:hypothetical protein